MPHRRLSYCRSGSSDHGGHTSAHFLRAISSLDRIAADVASLPCAGAAGSTAFGRFVYGRCLRWWLHAAATAAESGEGDKSVFDDVDEVFDLVAGLCW